MDGDGGAAAATAVDTPRTCPALKGRPKSGAAAEVCGRAARPNGFCGHHQAAAGAVKEAAPDDVRCRGVREQGANRGERCLYEATEGGYCGKHQGQGKLAAAAAQGGGAVGAGAEAAAAAPRKCGVSLCKNNAAEGEPRCERHMAARRAAAAAPRCAGVVTQGPRAGEPCTNAAGDGGLCEKHREAAAAEAGAAEQHPQLSIRRGGRMHQVQGMPCRAREAAAAAAVAAPEPTPAPASAPATPSPPPEPPAPPAAAQPPIGIRPRGVGGRRPNPVHYADVVHDGVAYVVGFAIHHGTHRPFVFDADLRDTVCGQSWHFVVEGAYVGRSATGTDGKRKVQHLHNVVMGVTGFTGKGALTTYDHISGNGADNRRCNLRPASQTQQNLNTRIRERTTTRLPPDCGVAPEDIPRNIWYMPAHGLHGDRFVVQLKGGDGGNIEWKSTSSKATPLKEKLREAIAKLEQLLATDAAREEVARTHERVTVLQGQFDAIVAAGRRALGGAVLL